MTYVQNPVELPCNSSAADTLGTLATEAPGVPPQGRFCGTPFPSDLTSPVAAAGMKGAATSLRHPGSKSLKSGGVCFHFTLRFKERTLRCLSLHVKDVDKDQSIINLIIVENSASIVYNGLCGVYSSPEWLVRYCGMSKTGRFPNTYGYAKILLCCFDAKFCPVQGHFLVLVCPGNENGSCNGNMVWLCLASSSFWDSDVRQLWQHLCGSWGIVHKSTPKKWWTGESKSSMLRFLLNDM